MQLKKLHKYTKKIKLFSVNIIDYRNYLFINLLNLFVTTFKLPNFIINLHNIISI